MAFTVTPVGHLTAPTKSVDPTGAQRLAVVDSLLRSLNSAESSMTTEWIAVANRRLEELRSGRVAPIPGNQVFAKVRERFGE